MLISPLLLLTLLMSHGLTVKTNEVKNNDSPFTMIGEVTSAIFFKNKINFISKFNVIGQINKFTGEVVSRIKLADREKIVHQDSESIVVSTKLSELV